jgi:hypothetical protein
VIAPGPHLINCELCLTNCIDVDDNSAPYGWFAANLFGTAGLLTAGGLSAPPVQSGYGVSR